MKPRWFRPWWLLFLIPVALGVARLRFDVEVLDLLPDNVPSVKGVKLYQQKFASSRELLVTVTSTNREAARAAAAAIADKLRADTNRVAEVIWQPPWLEHPEQTAELIASLWLNQPPEVFAALEEQLAVTNLPAVLAAAREDLASTLSPQEIARLSYDPFGLTRLPETLASAAQSFGQGEEMFASSDGTFRLLFVKSREELAGYQECIVWLDAIRTAANSVAPPDVTLGFTGRPAFVAEISQSMKFDIIVSVLGTAVLIALFFWLAHRRVLPMLWLLTLLALILGSTLALGGLLFGTINIVSMGFAAILLGLAVDYAVVHYQEALAHPDLTVPQIRRAIAPSIFWAAITTITAFLILNFGGLPGLAQLGSLVAIGVALAALVMIFAYLPPLFPDRMKIAPAPAPHSAERPPPETDGIRSFSASHTRVVFALSLAVLLSCGVILLRGLPTLDATAKALEPRDSPAYTTLDQIKEHLSHKRTSLWLVFSGRDETEVAQRLHAVAPIVEAAASNRTIAEFTLPTALWPNPQHQAVNRANAAALVARRDAFDTNALAGGFSTNALGLTHALLDTWQRATASTNVFWPSNPMSSWILEKLAVREPTNLYAVGFMIMPTNSVDLVAMRQLAAQLPKDGVWLAGWELLGSDMLTVVRNNLWKLVLPMVGLVLLSLWLAFRNIIEVALCLGVLLLSGLVLLATMQLLGWSWNLLNLMALPLILGTGVDYGLFMQLALRRHQGNLAIAHRSVGRALLLCGGTAIAGFGMLGFSSNAGMASLGQVCAVGISANMLLSIYALPVWWKAAVGTRNSATLKKPSALYSAKLWGAGLSLARNLPLEASRSIARGAALIYWLLARHRREIVIQNILPVLNNDVATARQAARTLFQEFCLKLVDLWRYEAGIQTVESKRDWRGWENFEKPHARGKGVLLVTPHLGNWELGAAFFVKHNIPLLVLTQAEPDAALTEMRQAARTQRGVETLVVGENAFAFVEIIKRLQAGATVALLVDRPPAATAVTVELFGKPFAASIAAAELARASGCAIVPGIIVRGENGYVATLLPEIAYDRAAIGDRETRTRLTQEILRAFEPAIRQNIEQWYHFVPIWPRS